MPALGVPGSYTKCVGLAPLQPLHDAGPPDCHIRRRQMCCGKHPAHQDPPQYTFNRANTSARHAKLGVRSATISCSLTPNKESSAKKFPSYPNSSSRTHRTTLARTLQSAPHVCIQRSSEPCIRSSKSVLSLTCTPPNSDAARNSVFTTVSDRSGNVVTNACIYRPAGSLRPDQGTG